MSHVTQDETPDDPECTTDNNKALIDRSQVISPTTTIQSFRLEDEESEEEEEECRRGGQAYHEDSSEEDSKYKAVIKEPRSFPDQYRKLIQEAPLVPATPLDENCDPASSSFDKDSVTTSNGDSTIEICEMMKPKWINDKLIEEGQSFVQRNFSAVIFAHMVALAFLLCVKPIQSLLLRTGAIHDRSTSLTKYLRTILKIKKWYESDLINSSKHFKDIFSVRALQKNAAKNFKIFVPPPAQELKLNEHEEKLLHALHDDLSTLDDRSDMYVSKNDVRSLDKIYTTVNPDVPLSQYDLSVIQFAFFGFIYLFPGAFGIHESQDKFPDGMTGFVHLWALLGKYLGLEDEFNLCIAKNCDNETNHRIFKDIFLLSFRHCDNKAVRLWKAMTSGSYKYCFFFRTKSLLRFMEKKIACLEHCHNLAQVMNYWEKICYYMYSFSIKWLLRFSFTRYIVNQSCKLVFYLSNKIILNEFNKNNNACYNNFVDLKCKVVS